MQARPVGVEISQADETEEANSRVWQIFWMCLNKKKSQIHESYGARGGVVVKALRYKPAGRGFDSWWCHWNFSVT